MYVPCCFRRQGPQDLAGITACNPMLVNSDVGTENLYEALGGDIDDKIGQLDANSLCKGVTTTKLDDLDDADI